MFEGVRVTVTLYRWFRGRPTVKRGTVAPWDYPDGWVVGLDNLKVVWDDGTEGVYKMSVLSREASS